MRGNSKSSLPPRSDDRQCGEAILSASDNTYYVGSVVVCSSLKRCLVARPRELLRLGNGAEQVHGKIRAAVQKALAHG